jgi:hypothetical protein
MGRNDSFLLIWDWYKKIEAKEFQARLKKHKRLVPLKTLYNWKARYKKAEREARELTKDW